MESDKESNQQIVKFKKPDGAVCQAVFAFKRKLEEK